MIVWRVLRVTGLLGALFLLGSVVLAATDGWSLLWQNRQVEARTAFADRVHANAQDAQAYLGLAIINEVEDRPQEAMQHWARFTQLDPAGWQASAFWYMGILLAPHTGQFPLLEQTAKRILDTPTATPALRASARLVLAQGALRTGDFATAKAAWASMGYVHEWRVIGPFDNVSRSGFAKVYPPEQELNFTRSYDGAGIDGLTVAWHPLACITSNQICQIEKALGGGDDGAVYYAATAVYVPTTQEMYLCWDPTGMSKLFLNGTLVSADEVNRDACELIADPFRFPVTLKQGWNTVLVKMASGKKDEASFRLRFTTRTGQDVTGLQVNPAKISSTAVNAAAADKTPVVSATVYLLQQQPATTLTNLALGKELYHEQDYQLAEDTLRGALLKTPDVSLLHWTLSETLHADDQQDEAHAERDLARASNHRIIAAELDYLVEQQETLKPTGYLQQLKELFARYPASPHVAWALADAYGNAEMQNEQVTTVHRALELAPGPDSYSHFYDDLSDEDNWDADAKHELAVALARYPNDGDLVFLQAERLRREGKTTDAIAAYQHALRLDPTDRVTYTGLANCYHNLKQLPQDAATLRTALQQFPQGASICTALADLLCEMQKKTEALALYRTAITIDPSLVELREKIQAITGEPSVLALAPATPADPILNSAKTVNGSAGAVVLLDEGREVVYPDYASELHVHQIVKILSDAGVKAFAEVYARGDDTYTSHATFERARVIKPDGKSQDYKEKSYGCVSFPALKVGDVIDVSYRVTDWHHGGMARYFWKDWSFNTDEAAVKLSHYVLITPPTMPITVQAHGNAPASTVTDKNGWRIREWRMADMPAIPDEMLAPANHDVGDWVDISTVPDWATVGKWYCDLSGPLCEPDAAVRAKAAELTKNAGTEQDKISKIEAFVAREIQYQSRPFRLSAYIPTEGKQVLRESYGDCKDKAALLVALLKAVGIHADMVLLNGRDDGLTPFLPSPRFSHAIACVQTEKGPLWVDATADQLSYGDLPMEDQGVPALIISESTTGLTTSPVLAPQTAQDIKFSTTIEADGTLHGDFAISFSGNNASAMREVMKSVSAEQQDMVQRVMLSKLMPNARYDSGSIDLPHDVNLPVTLSFKYHTPNYAATAGNFLLLKMPWLTGVDEIDDALGDPHRTQDVELAAGCGHRTIQVTITLPDGYTPQDLQPRIAGTTPWGAYVQTYQMDGHTLTMQCDWTLTALRVPRGDVLKLLDFLHDAMRAKDQQLVFKKS